MNKSYLIYSDSYKVFEVIINDSEFLININYQPKCIDDDNIESDDSDSDSYCELIEILKIKIKPKYFKIFEGKNSDQRNIINSLLVRISKKKYLYIGHRIYMFEPKDEIVNFISEFHNYDEKCLKYRQVHTSSYAVGINNTYLINNCHYVSNDIVKNDPYNQYYEQSKQNINLFYHYFNTNHLI